MKKKEDIEECKCNHDCECGENCNCTPENKCSEECNCHNECKCDEKHECDCDDACKCESCECENTDEDSKQGCECEDKKDYLNDLLRVQAEFDNYRKRMQTALLDARQDGFMDAIEKFLPAIDSFKMATDMITDKNTLMGIKFIEKGILDTLSKMGVNEIDCTGAFDPNFHQAIDTDTTTDAPPGSITKVAYKGFTYKDKVIRYAQVIVKK